MNSPERTRVAGPTFIRLLARFTGDGQPQSGPSLPEQLSRWIDWTPAVALSRALDGRPEAMHASASASVATQWVEQQGEVARVRASLASAIAAMPGADLRDPAPGAPDFSTLRTHYLATQRAMQTATGKLRGRLRDLLAGTSTDMARLAGVDALMEQVLSPREHRLLDAVPVLLEEHFERLRANAHEATPRSPAAVDAPAISGMESNRFRKDLQDALLAELEFRFLPIEGLLAALRTHLQGSHVQTFA
ncbi:MAG: DUF3348 family protein [Lysobacteraceae bacterium]|nr:MAG: DUF3348 family protein [Xanthomonadaceae bacterium]